MQRAQIGEWHGHAAQRDRVTAGETDLFKRDVGGEGRGFYAGDIGGLDRQNVAALIFAEEAGVAGVAALPLFVRERGFASGARDCRADEDGVCGLLCAETSSGAHPCAVPLTRVPVRRDKNGIESITCEPFKQNAYSAFGRSSSGLRCCDRREPASSWEQRHHHRPATAFFSYGGAVE